MSGITAMGTTFNLPNYHGQLIGLTPEETPFLSAIGGLTPGGGGMTDSPEFEWQTFDLRDPAQRVRKEGEAAANIDPDLRVRANVKNVCQVHQEKVSVSYTKQASTGAYAMGAAGRTPGGGPNPVQDELAWQLQQAIKSIKLDVNFSFINGIHNLPGDNAGKRQTRGLIEACQTNKVNKATVSYTASSATDTITVTHALDDGDAVIFTDVSTASGIVPGRVYYVVNKSTTVSFKVSETPGGAPITLGTASGLKLHKPWSSDLDVDTLEEFVQDVFDNGGLSGTPVFLVNSRQKRAIKAAYAEEYGKANPIQVGERIAGVRVDTVETDFGTFGIMLDRHVPQDAIIACSIEQCRPVFLNVPGKGVFFEEPLAKTGASDEVMLYGEVGLAYGSERAHGVLRGLKVA